MLPLQKIDALEKALAGDLLTAEDEEALRACVADCKRRIRLGNCFKISLQDVAEAFEILYDDVDFMTGQRRKRAIRLLIKAGARGYDLKSLKLSAEHPTDEAIAEGFRVDVPDQEVLDVHLEAS